jgi:predicted AAA+ superfamily ATPase
LKATHYWTDIGLGDFSLHFLRDKDKREVDFLVARDGSPWFLVEVKTSGREPVSKGLRFFHKQLGTAHAFQVAMDLDYVDRNCFEESDPVVVPAKTFLSQLV